MCTWGDEGAQGGHLQRMMGESVVETHSWTFGNMTGGWTVRRRDPPGKMNKRQATGAQTVHVWRSLGAALAEEVQN